MLTAPDFAAKSFSSIVLPFKQAGRRRTWGNTSRSPTATRGSAASLCSWNGHHSQLSTNRGSRAATFRNSAAPAAVCASSFPATVATSLASFAAALSSGRAPISRPRVATARKRFNAASSTESFPPPLSPAPPFLPLPPFAALLAALAPEIDVFPMFFAVSSNPVGGTC